MIIIKEYINNTETKYAENNAEYIDSIFTAGGTLAPFKKIQKRKNETLFFVDDESGYFERVDGLWGKFSTLDNGRKFFQWTTEKITRQ